MARNAKYYNSDNSPVLACTHGRYSHAFKSEWFQHPPCTAEQAEWLIHSYRRRGLPTTLARRHVQKLVPDLTDYQWYKGYADVIGKLVTKCWQEEAYAEAQLRKVTR